VVSVDATPASGWVFSHWVLNGSEVGSVNPYVVTMDASYELTAVFTERPQASQQLPTWAFLLIPVIIGVLLLVFLKYKGRIL
jgi:hypothetical protein